MNPIDIRIFLHHGQEVRRINEDNEWLAALLSGEAFEEKKPPPPKKEYKLVSNAQLRAIGG